MVSEDKRVEIERECPPCSGTGLYVGMAERDGAAVVCHQCKGTGRDVFRLVYKEFTGRKPRTGLRVVYATNPGIIAAPDVVPGGVPADEWAKDGRAPYRLGAEMREHTCPAWWYQSADHKRKPEWDECIAIGMFSRCEHFDDKHECWARWDRENGGSE